VFLRANRLEGLPLVGYGSLLNQASAARTIHPSARRQPVTALGARRVFNHRLDNETLRRYGAIDKRRDPGSVVDPRAIAALNVIATGQPEDTLNGVLFEVPAADIPGLCGREEGYDLAPVVCVDFGLPAGGRFPAYILTCPDEPRGGFRRTDNGLTPHWPYLEVCLEGARAVSREFYEVFLATTFLADGRTSLAEWAPELASRRQAGT
jgi:hypothetical protein